MHRLYPPVPAGVHSPDFYEPNRGTHLRHPTHPRIVVPQTTSELSGPVHARLGPADTDLTRQRAGEPIGERIILHGRVMDEDGRAVPGTLVEIWQANAAGRYAHGVDNHDAPLDPNFSGTGRAFTDAEGRYRFITIMPGRYPFGNHYNAWRPAHIHFSLLGPNFLTRLVTQMYFPGDPLQAFDPIYLGVPAGVRDRVTAVFDLDATKPDWALAFRFDIVLRGREATPAETGGDADPPSSHA
jgi:protocatechuate 3,4-dioxygenase beta subunit